MNSGNNLFRSLIAVGLVLVFAVTGTVIAIVSANRDNVGASIFETPLFGQNGRITGSQATHILGNINSGNIVNRNAEFRLFSQTGTGTAQDLSNLNWRMVNIDGNRVTFWAASTYRSMGFHNNANANSQIYSSSNLRTQMINDFNAVTAAWPTNVRNSNIPALGNNLDNGNLNDQIWLPRVADVQDGGAWGLTNNAGRAFTGAAHAWLRTSTRNGVTQVAHAEWRPQLQTQHIGLGYYAEWFNAWSPSWSFWRPGTPLANGAQYGATVRRYEGYYGDIFAGHSRQIVVSSETRTNVTTAHVPGAAAAVTSAGAMSTAVGAHTVTTSMGVRPAIHVSLSALQGGGSIEDGPGENDRVFNTGADISGASINMNDLFPAMIAQYRAQIAVGDWVRSHNANWPGALREVISITGSGNSLVTFGSTVWSPPEGGGMWGRPPGAMIFATTMAIEEDEVLLNDLFGVQAYRDTVRPGDLVLSTHEETLGVMRMIIGIAPDETGDELVIALGIVVGGGGHGLGLAELVAESYALGLSAADFANATDYAQFRVARFAAENALFYLTNLTAEEVMIYADALREAMELAI